MPAGAAAGCGRRRGGCRMRPAARHSPAQDAPPASRPTHPPHRDTIGYVLDIGYSLSRRFPDSPQTDYRSADVHSLRHDLFCGDVYLADTAKDREVSTAWGWVPVLDFAWALCDIVEQLDQDPR